MQFSALSATSRSQELILFVTVNIVFGEIKQGNNYREVLGDQRKLQSGHLSELIDSR